MTETSSRPTLTCITCRMLFTTNKEQRLHYKTNLHQFNLKRKIANLPPITEEVFEEKIAKLAVEEQKEKEDKETSHNLNCKVCNKKFSSENAMKQHLNSKKHQEMVLKKKDSLPNQTKQFSSRKKATVSAGETIENQIEEPMTIEEAELAAIDRKIANSRVLPLNECIFCSYCSKDFEKNLKHMTQVHSFFIPDIEYVKDLEGLIRYLGEKVSVGNICLYCNGRGKSFQNLEAVQQHMRDQSHCKILYDETNEGEYDDYFDFSSSYSHINQDPLEDEEEDLRQTVKSYGNIVRVIDGYEMTFKDGKSIGHRSLRTYYRQNFRPAETRDSVIVNSLLQQYRTLQLEWHSSRTKSQMTKRDQKLHNKNQSEREVSLGMQTNKIQKFMRPRNALMF